PTPIAVEEGLRKILQVELGAKWRIEKKGIQLRGSALTFNPDLVIEDGLVVGDVKYKLLGGEWRRSDLYQVIAFATAYRTRYGCLVGFRPPGTAQLDPLSVGDIHIEELAWEADPTLTAAQARQRFVAQVDQW